MRWLWIVLLSSGLAWAQEPVTPAAPPLTLAWVLEQARAQNPELKALAAERAAAWERVPQARAFDDPVFGVQLWNFPFDRAPGAGSMIMYQVSQPLPFPGKRALRGTVAAASARIAGENVLTREYEVVAAAKRLYYQLWVNRAARRINRSNQSLLEQIRKAALARVASGTAGIADVLRAETETARLETELVTLQHEREAVAAALNARLGRAADAPLGEPVEYFPAPVRYAFSDVMATARERRPDLRAAAVAVARGDAQLALAKRSRWPDFRPMVMVMQMADGSGASWGGMLGVTVPIWMSQKQSRAVKEMAADRIAAQQSQRTTLLEVERQVRDALARYDSAAENVRLYRDVVVPKARTTLDAVVAAYVAGRETLTAVLDGRRVLEDLELEHERTRAALEQARAELERAVGGTLP